MTNEASVSPRAVKILGRRLIPAIHGTSTLLRGVNFGRSCCRQTRRKRKSRYRLDSRCVSLSAAAGVTLTPDRILCCGPSRPKFTLDSTNKLQKAATFPARLSFLTPRGCRVVGYDSLPVCSGVLFVPDPKFIHIQMENSKPLPLVISESFYVDGNALVVHADAVLPPFCQVLQGQFWIKGCCQEFLDRVRRPVM